MVKRWEGIAEYVKDAANAASYSTGEYGDSWHGGSYKEALAGSTKGDESLVADAEKLMDKLDASVEVPCKHWDSSMYGAYPMVPEFLAGSPTPMRRMIEAESDNSPIAIYVSTTCSASISEDTMLKRGVAILALLMKMQQLRPVEVYLLSELQGNTDGELLQVIRIDSKPLDLSVACFVLARIMFARQLTYSMGRMLDGFNGSWPRRYRDGNWELRVRKAVGMSDYDLYIPAATEWDTMVTNPVEWVNDKVKMFTGRDEE